MTTAQTRRLGAALTILACTALVVAGCGRSEDPALLGLQSDLSTANAAIDSLTASLESTNQVIGGLRARADSLQWVDETLVASVQSLSKDVKQWRAAAEEQKRLNAVLGQEVERMRREKAVDLQTIRGMRANADSLNLALLVAHNSLRRQVAQIQNLEADLAQAQGEVTALRKRALSVLLLVGSEDDLKKAGFLETDRAMGQAFQKSYRMRRKLDQEDPAAITLPLREYATLTRRPVAIVDRFGRLRETHDYRLDGKGAETTIVFVNDLLKGSEALVVMER